MSEQKVREMLDWTTDMCDVFHDIPGRKFIARAEFCLPYRNVEDADALKAYLSEGPVTIIPSRDLRELLHEHHLRNARIRALEDELDKVKNAIAVLRGLGDGC